MVRINRRLEIPDGELSFTFSRSSGPGGQNVNKVNTRVTLLFDVAGSPSLSEGQRSRIMSRLTSRINREGILRISSQRHRSQSANREAAVSKFADLLGEALRPARKRKKTKVPVRAKKKRLEEKRKRSRLKRTRRKPPETEV